MSTAGGRRRVLIISENAPVPSDRRVWNIARSLNCAGLEVVIVCAAGSTRDQLAHEQREGIEIHRYELRPAGAAIGYAREYAQAMLRIRRIATRLARRAPFDVVHACNPPDTLLLSVQALRRAGTRFVFDHHDLVPELYISRFGRQDAGYRAALAAERLAFRLADVSLATNGSYASLAVERGGMAPEDVFVVRNGPDLSRFKPVSPDPALRRGREHLIAYLGIMGPQDGVDHAIRALAWLAEHRRDWHAIFIGDGDSLPDLRRLAQRTPAGDQIEFVGWQRDEGICRILSTADVCLAPDPPSPLNDVSTMIKIPEYMAMGRAVASYALPESKVSAGAAALYAVPGDPTDLGRVTMALLDDRALREEMGRMGIDRVERSLAWRHSEAALLAAYDRATEGNVRTPPVASVISR